MKSLKVLARVLALLALLAACSESLGTEVGMGVVYAAAERVTSCDEEDPFYCASILNSMTSWCEDDCQGELCQFDCDPFAETCAEAYSGVVACCNPQNPGSWGCENPPY
jgi:hypothetical protein